VNTSNLKLSISTPSNVNTLHKVIETDAGFECSLKEQEYTKVLQAPKFLIHVKQVADARYTFLDTL